MQKITVKRFAVPDGIDIVLTENGVKAMQTGTANKDIGHKVLAIPGARWATNTNIGQRFLTAIAEYLNLPVNEYMATVAVAERKEWQPYRRQEAYTG